MPLTLRANLSRPLTYQEADSNFTYVEGLGTAAQQAAQAAQAGADASVKTSSKGQSNGVASLDANAKVPSAQMPNSDSVSEGTSNAYFTQPRVRGTPLTGLPTPADSGISATDTVLSAFSKLQGQITAVVQAVVANAQSLAANVRATVLTGLDVSATAVVSATDTVLSGLGKLQGQISALGSAAKANLTASATDTTAGRVLKVSDFGVGAGNLPPVNSGDLNNIYISGTYAFSTPSANGPSFSYGTLIVHSRALTTEVTQIAFGINSSICEMRRFVSGAWTPWRKVYTAENILGTVSQVGGVPTGAIIETGTNANGTYIKYADGTLICSGVSTGPLTANTAGGQVFHSAAYAFTYPVAFVGTTPRISHSPLTSSGFYCWTAYEGTAVNTSFNLRVVSPANGASAYACYIAIGRWF